MSSPIDRIAKERAKQEAIRNRLTIEQQRQRERQIAQQLAREREERENPAAAEARKQAERQAHRQAVQEAFELARQTEGSQRLTVRTENVFDPDNVVTNSSIRGKTTTRTSGSKGGASSQTPQPSPFASSSSSQSSQPSFGTELFPHRAGAANSKQQARESIAAAESRVAAERQLFNERNIGMLTAGGRRPDGSRITSVSGRRPEISEKEITERQLQIILERAQQEGPDSDFGRLAEKILSDQRKTVTQGIAITGGSEEPELLTLKLRRGALTSEQLAFIKEQEASGELKYAGQVQINPDTGELSFQFFDVKEGKQYHDDLLATKRTNTEIARVNAKEQARYEREVAQIKETAADLGYEAVPVEYDAAGNPIAFEYRPIPGQQQYRYEPIDPTNPHLGQKKVPIGEGAAMVSRGLPAVVQPGTEFGAGIIDVIQSYQSLATGKEGPYTVPGELFSSVFTESKFARERGVVGFDVDVDRISKAFGETLKNPERAAGQFYGEATIALFGGEAVGLAGRGIAAGVRNLKTIQNIHVTPPRATITRTQFGTDPAGTGIKTETRLFELNIEPPKVTVTRKPQPQPVTPADNNIAGVESRGFTQGPPPGSVAKDILGEKVPKAKMPKSEFKPDKPQKGKTEQQESSSTMTTKQELILEEKKPKELFGKRTELPKEVKENLKKKRRIESEIAKDTATTGVIDLGLISQSEGAVTLMEKPIDVVVVEQPKKKKGAPITVPGYPTTFDPLSSAPAKESSDSISKTELKKRRKQESVVESIIDLSGIEEQTGQRGSQQLFEAGSSGLFNPELTAEQPQKPKQGGRGGRTTGITIPIVEEKSLFDTTIQPIFDTTTSSRTTSITDRPAPPGTTGRTFLRPPPSAPFDLPKGGGLTLGFGGRDGLTSLKKLGVKNLLMPELSLTEEGEFVGVKKGKKKKKGDLFELF